MSIIFWNAVGILIIVIGTGLGLYFRLVKYTQTGDRLYDIVSLSVMIVFNLISALVHCKLGSQIFMYIPIFVAAILFFVGFGVRIIWPAKY